MNLAFGTFLREHRAPAFGASHPTPVQVRLRALCICVWLALAPSIAGAGSFLPLGQITATGEDRMSFATGVSDDGLVVVGSVQLESFLEFLPFRWTPETGAQILLPLSSADQRAFAQGVSGDGIFVVGSSGIVSRSRSVLWQAPGLSPLALPDLASGTNVANAISGDGRFIVGRSGRRVALWPPEGGVVSFDGFNGASVSDDGRVIGGNDGGGWRIVDRGPREALPLRTANDMSADGSVLVGRCLPLRCRGVPGPEEAALWSEATGLLPVGVLPGDTLASFSAVSADGGIAVGFSTTTRSTISVQGDGIVWDEAGGLRSVESFLADEHGIDLGGWRPLIASGISRDGGAIVGAAVDSEGRIEAFLARLAPECSDGIDNDGDGAVDLGDGGCDGDPERDSEKADVVPAGGVSIRLAEMPEASQRGADLRATLRVSGPAPDPTGRAAVVAIRRLGASDYTLLPLADPEWKTLPSGHLHRAADAEIESVHIHRDGRIGIRGRSSALIDLLVGAPSGVEIQLVIGGEAYCAVFAEETGAHTRFRERHDLADWSGFDAQPPVDCEAAL